MVPVKSIQPFHDHPFHLYEGERLEDMIASVKEHGVLNPVIVQKLDTGYEMLSGHNRWNAAKLAGIKEIPAIVKTDLSEEEAYVYVIETNLMQRSFSDLAISEKAAVLKARYEKEACQGKRNDILEEIARMEGKEVPVTYGHGDQRLNTRDMIGKEYELSGSSVGRLLKLNDLIKPFKDMVDRGALYTKVALQLAFLPENEQAMVYEIMKEKKTKITIEMVMKLRSHSGALTEAMVKRYLSKEPIKKKCYKVPARIVEKYFEGMDPNQVDSIVEQALEAWFSNPKCKGIVYIDCMSNSGVYKNDDGEEIKGTPLLVSEIIADAMQTYTDKKAYIYFNDVREDKIDLLKTRLPKQTSNFQIYTEVMDANELLRTIGNQFATMFKDMHFLLVYDPYDAHIEWDAMMPFLKNWGEIIINHMVSDTIRAAKTARIKLEQMADNEVRKIQEMDRLEEEEKEFFGFDLSEYTTTQEIHNAENPWLNQKGLQIMIEQYLNARLGQGTYILGEGDVKQLRLSANARLALREDFRKLPAGRNAVRQTWDIYLKGKAPLHTITFDSDAAEKNRDAFFITAMHPLARQAAEYYESNEKAYIRLQYANDDLPVGAYHFSVYAWSYRGMNPHFRLVVVCDDDVIAAELPDILQEAQSGAPAIKMQPSDCNQHLGCIR